MSENQFNTLIVALLVIAWILIERADKADVFAKLVDRLRVRLSRRVPVGRHGVENEGSCRVGHPDTTLIFKLRVKSLGQEPQKPFTGVADASTRFTVRDATATADEFLEAYDDSLGPIEIQVLETGRIAEMSIASTNL